MGEKITYFILSIAFVALVNYPKFSTEQLIFALSGYALITGLFSLFFHRKVLRKFSDLTFMLFPFFWIVANTFFLFFFYQSGFLVFAFSVFSAYLLYLILLEMKPKIHSVFIENTFFVSVSGIFIGLWTLDFFLTPAWWIVLLLHFGFVYGFLQAGFATTLATDSQRMVYSLVLALVFAEISWAMLFWPLHNLTSGVVSATLFYAGWSLTKLHLSGELDRKRTIFYGGFAVMVLLITILTASWIPVL